MIKTNKSLKIQFRGRLLKKVRESMGRGNKKLSRPMFTRLLLNKTGTHISEGKLYGIENERAYLSKTSRRYSIRDFELSAICQITKKTPNYFFGLNNKGGDDSI